MIDSLSSVLVIVAAVTLALGWFQDGLALVHVSIATCLVALALLGVDRLLRRRAPAVDAAGGAAVLSGATAVGASSSSTAVARPVMATAPVAGEVTDANGGTDPASTPGAASTTAPSVSELEQVRGLGPAKRGALLDRFGSVEAIAAATPDELSRTPGIGAGLARAIADQLG